MQKAVTFVLLYGGRITTPRFATEATFGAMDDLPLAKYQQIDENDPNEPIGDPAWIWEWTEG